jgi:glycosyltransferase involved in cell wall biosynthesis
MTAPARSPGLAAGRRTREDAAARNEPVKISIIVPAYNEEKLLPATLRSIQEAGRAFDDRGWATELIVCDNNSTDTTARVAQAAGAQVVFEPFNQIARARNSGARAASGDWLLFIDADSRPSAGLFADVADEIQSGTCLAGGSWITLEGESPLLLRASALWNWISTTLRYAAGSFIFCEAAAFRETGGFNQELFASEEIDLSRRLKRLARRRGRRVVILERHPLLTSTRKLHLYSKREYAWFLLKTVLTFKRNLRRREECAPWYDGRR